MSPQWCLSRGTVTAAIITIMLTSQPQFSNTEPYYFGPFNESDVGKIFYTLQSARIYNDILQLTPYVSEYKNGRAFFMEPFKLWEDHPNGKLASFTTSFLFTVSRVRDNNTGEGFAFLISPSLSIPPYSTGQYLGLTNVDTDGDAANQFVAIELDTVQEDDFDPDDNHIGLNINSIRSNLSVPLSPFGLEISPKNGSQIYYVVWVDYDGTKKVIDVFMAVQPDKDAPIAEKPKNTVLSSPLDLRGLVSPLSYFGFSASTSGVCERNDILKWNLSVENIPEQNGHSPKTHLVVVVVPPVLAVLLVGITGVVYYYLRKKTKVSGSSDPTLLRTLSRLVGAPREFRFSELKKATNNFDDEYKLGQGGFGIVYKGILPEERTEVAVKKFSRDRMKSTDDFLSELTIINRLRHKNLVRLLGWCHKDGALLLVYDYMPNGSLDKHIFCKEGTSTTPLSWHLRYNIILGVASALNYLHNEFDQKVIHRDLKASNIMLDSNFNARLGDFGLARALESGKSSYAELRGVPGTMGYIAPECLYTGKASCESDVYGFGAVLLEVVCGQRPWTEIQGYHFLVDWVWHLHGEGRILEALDPRLGNVYDVEEVEMILKLGLACSHPISSERPKMQSVVQILSGLMPVPHVLLLKPSFVWPAMDLESSKCDLKTIATIENTPINTEFFAR